MNEDFASRWHCCKKAWKRYKKSQRELVKFDAQREHFESTLKEVERLPLDLRQDPLEVLTERSVRDDLWKQQRKNLVEHERQQRVVFIRATRLMLLCRPQSN